MLHWLYNIPILSSCIRFAEVGFLHLEIGGRLHVFPQAFVQPVRQFLIAFGDGNTDSLIFVARQLSYHGQLAVVKIGDKETGGVIIHDGEVSFFIHDQL